MKVRIGPYINWFGPYQLADKIKVFGFSEETANRLGDFLSDGYIEKFLTWVSKKRKRKIDVKIDDYDTWGMYETLSVIIAPMLRQLRDTKLGYPLVDNKDVPVELRVKKPKNFYMGEFTEKHKEVENKEIAKWDWVLNEMIFAFEQYESRVRYDKDWEEQFHSGEMDMKFVETEIDGKIMSTIERGPNHTFAIDTEGMKKYADRIQNGFTLFGKYYLNLWD
jgi:hypothetical protein